MHQIRIIVFVQVGKISFVHRFFPQCLRLSATFISPQKVQNYAEQMSIFTPKTIWLRFIAPNNAGRLTNKCLEIASTNTHTHTIRFVHVQMKCNVGIAMLRLSILHFHSIDSHIFATHPKFTWACTCTKPYRFSSRFLCLSAYNVRFHSPFEKREMENERFAYFSTGIEQ